MTDDPGRGPDLPQAPAELRRLAADLLAGGDGAAAVKAAVRAVEADPREASGWCLLAVARARLGDTHHATAAARDATGLRPGDWWTWVQLAQVAAGDPDTWREALHAAREAVRLAPSEPAAHRAVATVLATPRDGGAREMAGAIDALGTALRLEAGASTPSSPQGRPSGRDLGAVLGRRAASPDPVDGTTPRATGRALERVWWAVDDVFERFALLGFAVAFGCVAVVALASGRVERVVVAVLSGAASCALVAVLGRWSPGTRHALRHRLRRSRPAQLFAVTVPVGFVLPLVTVLAAPPRPELWLGGACVFVAVVGRGARFLSDRGRPRAERRRPGVRAGTGASGRR